MAQPPVVEVPGVAWVVGVFDVPDSALIGRDIAPTIEGITSDKGIHNFARSLAARDPPVLTCAQLKETLTWAEVQAAQRATMKRATLVTTSKLLTPSSGAFKWAASITKEGERKRGGVQGQNNKPKLTLD